MFSFTKVEFSYTAVGLLLHNVQGFLFFWSLSVKLKGTVSYLSLFLFEQTSDLWNKRHSVAIGDVNECKLIRRKDITPKQVDHIWKSMTIAQYVTPLHINHFHCLC